MCQKEGRTIKDVPSERAVLAGIVQFGIKGLSEVEDIIEINTFQLQSNQVVFKCLITILGYQSTIDVPSILSTAQSLGFEKLFTDKSEQEYLRSLFNFPIKFENLRNYAKKIAKLYIATQAQLKHQEAYKNLEKITGNESIDEILALSEDPVLNFTFDIHHGSDNEPIVLTNQLEEYVNFLIENPRNEVGIPTGFPEYDKAIGGGARRGSVQLISARPKAGKSITAKTIATYVGTDLNIPVLLLDTEMNSEEQMNRLIATISNVNTELIETGKFGQNPVLKDRVLQAVNKIKNGKLYYKSIGGKTFNEILSMTRRWLFKKVGFDDNGNCNDCLIIYDYFKVMNKAEFDEGLQEYQVLGFNLSALVDFCQHYHVPCISFCQLNRDKDIAQSDRLLWFCSSSSFLARKTPDEIAEDGEENGNGKLIVKECRHGLGLYYSDYINLHVNGHQHSIREGKTRFQVLQEKQNSVVNEDTINFNE